MGHTQLVAMTAIPGESLREPHSRSNLTYSKYSRATWDWWCRKNGIGFTVLDRPLEDDACRGLPPSLQRWIAPSILMKEMGTSGQVLMIDADVMIRWDSPSPFDLAGSCFAAVQDSYALWVQPSIKAYQPLFPNVTLNWWEYFNTGLTIVNNSHCDMLRDFVRFAYERWTDWRCIQQSGNFGIDQTPLNFFLRQKNVPLRFIPPTFNLLHCFPMNPILSMIEQSKCPDLDFFRAVAFSQPNVFDFIDFGYIWHFTNVVVAREIVMERTWQKIHKHYQ